MCRNDNSQSVPTLLGRVARSRGRRLGLPQALEREKRSEDARGRSPTLLKPPRQHAEARHPLHVTRPLVDYTKSGPQPGFSSILSHSVKAQVKWWCRGGDNYENQRRCCDQPFSDRFPVQLCFLVGYHRGLLGVREERLVCVVMWPPTRLKSSIVSATTRRSVCTIACLSRDCKFPNILFY